MFSRLLSVLLALLPAIAAAGAAPVHEFLLDNGLKVIVKEEHRAPVAVSQVWYRIGSSYEEGGRTGLSHLLEHMMFKGTRAHGPGEFSRIVAELGGSENAFTSRDYTAYFETLSVEHLDRALELEADRMRNVVFEEKEFRKELAVVMEERRMRTDDSPSGLTYEQLMAVAWRASPYQNPVIGWMDDLANMEIDALQRWYDFWYQPNNATLVVVGDVDPQQVLALAKKHFGPIPAGKVPAPRRPAEPEQRGITRVTVKAPAKQPYVLMGYKVPNLASAEHDWEPYALTVAAAVLDGGASARLARDLVRGRKIAASAGAQYDLYSRLPGLFLFDGTPTEGHRAAEVEQALREEVKRLQETLVSREELDRVVTQAVAAKVFQADSIFYQAMEIGILETIGLDWHLLEREIERLRAVTPEQVQAVARKYLKDDYLTVATLVPQPTDKPVRTTPITRGTTHGK
ncbi:M16 family metallopeptidase [endosymbiont of unidentified scaly snail isolate Monju]|uniref:M16 family metallopeptidase n=1 Tax=endosymbiont of unidentified scaly snail isolate Monju TaxID=1248727 RepID=UPI0003892481|nr:pitrilysin family protein [endosymbiont of unidentified scaly snail isolate Monju]BAN68255.1 M16 family peptidase [endosymbiont of unidentified scaly snail isolate Monju]